ncbi:hypothetical protein [Pandoraea pulmonicola]|uniref:Uncharacterized protein n=1 Tax=Pandoraea pulmonicola TaxID=93221 RepID=A0AAJ4Z905_PANPU|nr:hypothetical protein [Pandoraea pulmonicola]AJC22023.1 hypothetical protein RO07_18795 [Pandoraea pulmonicola]SUA88997.1 Uncharacterised protein [Pandoraea pulmonicola]
MYHEYVGYAGCPDWPMKTSPWSAPAQICEKGVSIAEKRSEIAAQLMQLRNTCETLNLSTYSVDKLTETFEKSFDKATAGYWRGGLRDPFWRCITTPDRPGFFCSMVGEQLDQQCAELLTPSARRFLKVLTAFGEALEHERDMLNRYGDLVKRNHAASRGETHADAGEQWQALEGAKRRCMALYDETAPLVEKMRRAIDRACASVRPDKKHHGTREAITGGVYAVAAVVAAVALSVASVAVAIVGFAVTVLIRCVSLGSIRGFDREKGWKAVEDLLNHTREFINSEEHRMYSNINRVITWEQADQQALAWKQGEEALKLARENWRQSEKTLDLVHALQSQVKATSDSVSALDSRMSGLSGRMSRLEEKTDDMAVDLKRVLNLLSLEATSRTWGRPSSREAPSDRGDGARVATRRAPMERAESLETYRSGM